MLLWQSILLAFSFILAFAWQSSPLAEYTIQAIGFLVLVYLISSISKHGINFSYAEKKQSLSIIVLNLVVILLIFSTGGFNSSFFFLIYFLAFGIAFVFHPLTVFVFALGVVGLFLPDAIRDDVFSNMLRIGSLLLISPLAYFFGREYRLREFEEKAKQEQNEQTKKTAQHIESEAKDVFEKEKGKLKIEEEDELKDVIKEAEELEKL